MVNTPQEIENRERLRRRRNRMKFRNFIMGRGGSGAAAGAFSLLSLSPALWLDASDTATITHVANAVSQWDDKSGNGNHATQATGAAQPTTNTRTINALNTIDFDGTSDFMGLTSVISAGGGYTAFVVFEVDDLVSDRQFFGAVGPGNFAFKADSTGALQITRQGQASIILGTPGSLLITTPYIALAETATAGNSIFLNGGVGDSNAVDPAYTVGVSRIAAGGTPSDFFDGKVAEIAIFQSILTPTQENQVGNYLEGKWGITWTNV